MHRLVINLKDDAVYSRCRIWPLVLAKVIPRNDWDWKLPRGMIPLDRSSLACFGGPFFSLQPGSFCKFEIHFAFGKVSVDSNSCGSNSLKPSRVLSSYYLINILIEKV